jgi:hypothetical protein
LIQTNKALFVILSLILVSAIFPLAGCSGKAGTLEDKTSQVGLSIETLSAYTLGILARNYVYPDEKINFDVTTKDVKLLPKKTAYVFTFIQTAGGNFLQELEKVYDQAIDAAGTGQISFKNEGTYTVRCDLYDTEQYKSLGVAAPRLGTVEKSLTVQSIKLEVNAEPAGEGVYHFSPKVLNPEFLPSGYYYRIIFGDDNQGVFASDEDITHEYIKDGTFTMETNLVMQLAGEELVIGKTGLSVVVGGSALSIVAPSGPLEAGQDYTFRALMSGILPDAPSFEWDFGDSGGLVIPFSNEATHMYEKEGNYIVTVKLFASNEASAALLGTATKEIIVEAGTVDFLSYLQQTTHLLVSVGGDTTLHQSDGKTYPYDGSSMVLYSVEAVTIWRGTHFSQNYYRAPGESGSGITVTIEGDVSEDGKTILNLSATIIYDDSNNNPGELREQRITLVNAVLQPKSPIPVSNSPNYKPQFTAYLEGPEVANYVTSTYYEYKQPKPSDPGFTMWYDPFRFENTTHTPFLLVVFKTFRIDAYDDPGYQQRQ